MKDKLFNALKQAYPQLGLSDEILRHHATMLAATVTVTDENLNSIVEAQKDYLQGLQAENDKRATSATATAKAKAEAEKQAAIDEAVKAALAAERKRVQDEAEKAKKEAEEEAKRKAQEKEEPEFMKAFREEMKKKEEERTAANAELQKKIDELLKNNEEQGKTINSLKDENDKMKAEQAKTERANLIKNTAVELGIPQWRIDEGFSIPADADEAGIKEVLGKVANNIKVNTMQGGGSHILDDNRQVTKEEAKDIADSLMK